MDWSTRKKMGCFGLVAAVVLVLGGWFVYSWFLSAPETCFDAKQNQNERGVDCGGICTRVCLMDARVVVPVWSRAFKVANGVYNAVAYIENQNPSAGIQKISYEFRAYDDRNILAAEPVTGTTFIGPNDKTAIFASPITTGNRIPKDVFFRFTTSPDWMTVDPRYQVPQLTSSNTPLTDLETAPKLTAEIRNQTLFDYRDIEVVVILYGEDGNAVNASRTYIDYLPQQSSKTVYFTWLEPFSAPVTRIEILPRLNPFVQP